MGSCEKKRPIGIVESEKSAVLLSELRPELLWLAWSYTANFTIDRLEPLKGRKVILFPRASEAMEDYIFCINIADEARRLYNLDITVSRILEDDSTPDQKSRNIDIIDYIFES